jgi:hypothetical protein
MYVPSTDSGRLAAGVAQAPALWNALCHTQQCAKGARHCTCCVGGNPSYAGSLCRGCARV